MPNRRSPHGPRTPREPHTGHSSETDHKPVPAPPPEPSAPCASDCIYVDGIEDGVARLLIVHPSTPAGATGSLGDDWREYRLPLHVLPAGLHEGEWLNLNLQRAPAPNALLGGAPSLREELGKDDDGGDFSL